MYSAKEPVPVLVFEDAAMHGYGKSSGPLNIEGTMFVAAKLAKFHAASVFMDHDVSFGWCECHPSCQCSFLSSTMYLSM